MAMVDSVTSKTFDEAVLDFPGRVLLDIYTDRCPPCRQMSPILDSLAQDLGGRLKVVKLNAAEDLELATSFGVTAVPTFLVFQNGEKLRQQTGAMTREELEAWVLA